MAVGVEPLGTPPVGKILVVLVKKAKAGLYHGDVLRDVAAAVAMDLECHHAELQAGVPLVLEPCIALHAGIEALGALGAVLGIAGQAVVLYLFGQAGSLVSPIEARAFLGIAVDVQIEVELWLQQVPVAVLEHGPVDQPLVLGCMDSPTPVAEVG